MKKIILLGICTILFVFVYVPVETIITDIMIRPVEFDDFKNSSTLEVIEDKEVVAIKNYGEQVTDENEVLYLYSVVISYEESSILNPMIETKTISSEKYFDFSVYESPKIEVNTYSYVYNMPYADRKVETRMYINIPALNYEDKLPSQDINDNSSLTFLKTNYNAYVNSKGNIFIKAMITLCTVIVSMWVSYMIGVLFEKRFIKKDIRHDKYVSDDKDE